MCLVVWPEMRRASYITTLPSSREYRVKVLYRTDAVSKDFVEQKIVGELVH